jgi:hypothetical protein
MRLFPELVAEKHAKRVFHILVPRNGIVRRLRIGDQIVYPRPFLRTEIKDWVIVSFQFMRFPQIFVIFIAKTPSDRGGCDGKNQAGHSRECGQATPVFFAHSSLRGELPQTELSGLTKLPLGEEIPSMAQACSRPSPIQLRRPSTAPESNLKDDALFLGACGNFVGAP